MKVKEFIYKRANDLFGGLEKEKVKKRKKKKKKKLIV